MRILPTLCFCASILSISPTAIAGDFYVDPVIGKDISTAGKSATTPWKTIAYAIAQATKASAAAHTFHLATGQYAESPTSTAIPPTNLETMTFIGASRRTTVVAGSFAWGPSNGIHLESLTCTGLAANTTTTKPANVSILDCSIGTCSLSASKQGSYHASISDSRLSSFDINLGSHTKSELFARTSFFGSGGAKILGFSDAAGSVLLFEDCRFENSAQDGLSAQIQQSKLTIRRCNFRGAKRYGINLNSRYEVKNGNTVQVEDTTILACGSAGIRAAHDARTKKHTMHDRLSLVRCVLSENLIGLNDTDWGLLVQDSLIVRSHGDAIRCTTSLPTLSILIQRSTLDKNRADAIALQGLELSTFKIDNCMLTCNGDGVTGTVSANSGRLDMESCTVADNTGSGLSITGMTPKSLSVHHTIFGGNQLKLSLQTGSVIQYCLSDTQSLAGSGNRKGNPRFENPSLGLYQLTATSPAIDAGRASLIQATQDYEGDPRVISVGVNTATPDIGADEYSLLGLSHVTAAATVPWGMPSPSFNNESLARIGEDWSATLVGTRSSNAVLWIVGLSDRRFLPTLPLPLDLAPVSQPGILLHARLDWTGAGLRKSNGDAAFSFSVPDEMLLPGIPVSIQALILGKEGLGTSALLRAVIGKPQTTQEQFTNQARLDPTASGAEWGAGRLVPGKLGGSGIHGKFQAGTGQFLGVSQGIKRYLWNTDLIRIPFGQTLNGEAYWKKKLGANKTHLVITTGVLEFSEFVLPADEAIIFRGKNMPQISSIGDMEVDGQILLDVNDASATSVNGRGAAGAVSSLGGGSGGQGGDVPAVPAGSIDGRNGSGAVVAAGHPRSTQAAASAGRGSQANPATGLNSSIVYFGTGGFACRMTAAGGAGGSLWSPDGKSLLGQAGVARSMAPTTGPTFPPHNAADLGRASIPGLPFPILPVSASVTSRVLFGLGGSGGGGGGSSACGSFPSSISWLPGVGGGAGGGHFHLMAGHALSAGSKAKILARGGDGAGRSNSSMVAASGGGGSGGSILIQCGVPPSTSGEINVLGGTGGIGQETTWLEVGSSGGAGGAGMIRFESVPAPKTSALTGLKPPVTSQNVGLLRAIDHVKVTTATSKWYATRYSSRPIYSRYTLTAKVNGKPITYSDDGKHQKAEQGQPIVFLIQSANLDPKTGRPVGATTGWYEGSVQSLNSDARTGNGFRFMIRLDLSVPGTNSIEVQDLVVAY